MRVLKFGGSSIATAENIKKVAVILEQNILGKQVVVVSALSGVTDELIQIADAASLQDESYKKILSGLENRHIELVKSLLPVTQQSSCLSVVKQSFNELEELCEGIYKLNEISPRTKDRILSFGELLSSRIIAAWFQLTGKECLWADTRKLILTDTNYGSATVNFNASYELINAWFQQNVASLYIAPGFIANDMNGNVTTLGRGGSDYTAAIIAAALQTGHLEIWTDVNGMMTADPRRVPSAKTIAHISYQEAMELSSFGAKVVYPLAIKPVMDKNIPVWIKNTFDVDALGTLIENLPENGNGLNGETVRGISSMNHVAILSLEGSGMIGVPGFSKRLFEALAEEKINVILITQSSSEHSICVAINGADKERAKIAVDKMFVNEIQNGQVEPLKIENSHSIIALVGDRMRSYPGISGRMFYELGRNGINIRAIAQGSSERNISAVISTHDVKKALNILHETFFDFEHIQLNVYLAGTGNVGRRLIDQIKQQQAYLLQSLRLRIKVTGLINSRKMLLSEDGIDLDNWQNELENAPTADLNRFITEMKSKNLHNTVFADVTASNDVANAYDNLLAKSISVVACNKIACSSGYDYYQKLKQLSRQFNAAYLFETNVGAGLPVIGTLNDLLRSGDRIHKIEAVLSGTLNYVFNHYDGKKCFADIVQQAQDEGYTEPDPRLDLGGTDVMRKIMILSREAGAKMEINEVENEPFLPASCFEGNVDDFYKELKRQENHFQKLYQSALANDCKLKFVASFENGKATTGLKQVPERSDFYHLYGKDNIVLFYTDRYSEQPLIVKGAGAGAEVTASGVFADILRVVS